MNFIKANHGELKVAFAKHEQYKKRNRNVMQIKYLEKIISFVLFGNTNVVRHAVTNLKLMAVFRNHPTEWYNHDWTILRNGSISLYWRKEYLNSDIEWFQKEKYNIVRFDCSTWIDEDKMHQDLYDKLKLPDYYGSNYDALDECLEDIEVKDTGLIIAFEHFDRLQNDTRQTLLNIFDRASRFHLLMGNRVINLLQVDNPEIEFEPIKAYHVNWNRREWYTADRQQSK